MDDQKLQQLVSAGESERLERKPSLSQVREIRRAVCAFANDLPGDGKPGVVAIGLDDQGACAGLPIDDDLLRRLSELRSDGSILPFPDISVRELDLDSCKIAVVVVQPSTLPPVRLRGRVFVRVGPTTRQASPQEERRLAEKRRAADLPFDLTPVANASIDDFDLGRPWEAYLQSSVAQDVLDANDRPLELQLSSLRFTSAGAENRNPTILGVLVIGKEPRAFLPGAYVQFLRLDGEKLTDPIKDQKEIDGSLSELLNQLDGAFKAHISVGTDITGADLETRQPEYPLVALQQLARNAILHRVYEGTNAPVRITWFSDRIEIFSPGGPFGLVNRENFGQPGVTDYRNPSLAETMKNLGYVQKFGAGISLAREELRKNGSPGPEFEVDANYVLVTLRRRP